jgi:glycine/D-amino acid oxidase-like deaminating enzyme
MSGLGAGLTLARAGRSVQIFDRQRPGEGASPRNGGIASGNLRPATSKMRRKFGEARAQALQAKAAREELAEFVKRENIECDFRLVGRFSGAAKASEYERLAREADHLRKTLRIEAHAVPKAEQRSVLGTDFYYGGLLRDDIGDLHPAKFFAGRCQAARAAGATVHGGTAVLGFAAKAGGFAVETARGARRGRPRHRCNQRLYGRRGPMAAAAAGAGAQPHHCDRPALKQPDGAVDAQTGDVRGNPQAPLLLSALTGRYAHSVRRPRRQHRR